MGGYVAPQHLSVNQIVMRTCHGRFLGIACMLLCNIMHFGTM
jgi:hypothetical protein